MAISIPTRKRGRAIQVDGAFSFMDNGGRNAELYLLHIPMGWVGLVGGLEYAVAMDCLHFCHQWRGAHAGVVYRK
jgi:hypothetical protein